MRFQPQEMRNLGKAIETEMLELFKKARVKLNDKPREVQPEVYTMLCISAALVYTQVIEWADQDLIEKSKVAIDFNNRMQDAAKNSEEAERASTIKKVQG